MDLNSLTRTLNSIDMDDLPYVEQDLSYYELVSLGFLLYGGERTTAAFVLQKLLVISNTSAATSGQVSMPRDLLRSYADKVNKGDWRPHLVESLAVINARRVLRKLGFKWELVRQHYLPHIAEFSLHIHPMLKALYKVCEQLNQASTGRLILYMDEHFRKPHEHLHFYDTTCLEVFLLDWITRDVINVGRCDGSNVNVHVLCEYFKLHDLDDLKTILIETINNNSDNRMNPNTNATATEVATSVDNVRLIASSSVSSESITDINKRYNINFENAGFILIINQKEFYEEPDPAFKDMLPKKKFKNREGSDVDKKRLVETFASFGYKAITHDNLKHFEILQCIRETAKRSLLRDSLVVCILSHGCNGAVYGSNSVPVSISDIEETFTLEELNGTPKLLIVQACQTDESNISVSERKSSSPLKFADIYKAMSTVAGFPSFRNTVSGSWFIQSLCAMIMKLGKCNHFADIMTAVASEVAEKRGSKSVEVMLPTTWSTLRRYFYLPQKKESS